MAKPGYTLPQLLEDLASGKNPAASKVRGIISRDLQKYFKSSDQYDSASIQVINAFNNAVAQGQTALDTTPFSDDPNLVGPNPMQLKTRGAGKISDQDIRKFFVDIIPSIFENRDLGHANISVLTFKLEAALSAGYLPKNLEIKVKQLLRIAKYIDSLEGGARIPKGKVKETLLEIIETMKVRGEWDKKVSFSKNLANLKVEYIAEEREGNQAFKGQLAAQLGRVFSRLQKGNEQYFEQVIEGKGIENLKSSPGLLDDVEDLFLEKFQREFPGTKNFKAKKPKPKRTNGTHTPKAKKKPARKKKAYPSPVYKEPKAARSQSSVVVLLGILNQKLPEVVAKNMGSPALNYRTGRFASSVKAVDVTRTSQGFPSVGYTYQKNPYQTFELGYAQGSPEQDPRKLIDRSIREIAAGLAIGRFYTRRV